MGSINTRVVRRSNHLLPQRYGDACSSPAAAMGLTLVAGLQAQDMGFSVEPLT